MSEKRIWAADDEAALEALIATILNMHGRHGESASNALPAPDQDEDGHANARFDRPQAESSGLGSIADDPNRAKPGPGMKSAQPPV